MTSSFHYGVFSAVDFKGEKIELPLANCDLLSAPDITARYAIKYTEAVQIRQNLEVAFLDAFFARAMPTGPVLQFSNGVRQHFVDNLGFYNNISPETIELALDRYCNGELENHPNRIERWEYDHEEGQQFQQDHSRLEGEATEQHSTTDEGSSAPTVADQGSNSVSEPQETRDNDSSAIETHVDADHRTQNARLPAATVTDRSEHSWHGETQSHGEHKKQTVLGLIYHIAEEQARKEGYVHRGVTCNGCSTLPIRGVRYRCTNCADYDLCELCESQQVHDRTHLFYKVRIPAPFLGNPRQPQPVWYPGKPRSNNVPLNKDDNSLLSQRTGLQMPVLEALWEQFKCLAAVDYPEDPTRYYLAIDRPTFDKCFVPKSTTRPPPPNLIYDRMFCFYDTNDDGLIGFQEFVFGISSIGHKKPEERLRQIFNGYDVDNDKYVSRIDFQRLFKALFSLHKELAKDIVTRIDDEVYDEEVAREVINSSQALSSAFSGSIPPGDPSRMNDGKSKNIHGDYLITGTSITTVKPEDDYPKNWHEEQDYGQEILYQVIHESINELLDPLFRFREDVGLEAHRSRAERHQYPEQLAQLRKAGFWLVLEVLINRFEQKWRVKSSNTLLGNDAQLLIEYISEKHIYKTYNPSIDYIKKRERHIAELFAPFLKAGLITRDDLIPPWTLAEVGGHKIWMAHLQEKLANLAPQHDQDQAEVELRCKAELDDVQECLQELTSPPITPLEGNDVFQEQSENDEIASRAENMKEESPSLAESQSTSAPILGEDTEPSTSSSDESSSDADPNANQPAEPVDYPLTQTLPIHTPRPIHAGPDASEIDLLRELGKSMVGADEYNSERSPYDFPTADRPTDPTLPQNRNNGIDSEAGTPNVPASTNADSSNAIPTPNSTDAQPNPDSRDHQPKYPLPSMDRLKYLSLMELLAKRDDDRGGPGRISWPEFEEIMKGPRGGELGFLGAWIEMATF